LETVAEMGTAAQVGARGLRMILEDLMLELNVPPADAAEGAATSWLTRHGRGREINWNLLEKAG